MTPEQRTPGEIVRDSIRTVTLTTDITDFIPPEAQPYHGIKGMRFQTLDFGNDWTDDLSPPELVTLLSLPPEPGEIFEVKFLGKTHRMRFIEYDADGLALVEKLD